MKLTLFLSLTIGFLFMNHTISATTLTIYPANGKCIYVLSEGKTVVARWTVECNPALERAENISIKKGSALAQKILEIKPGQNLEKIHIARDGIDVEIDQIEYKLGSIPLIKINDRKFKKCIVINNILPETGTVNNRKSDGGTMTPKTPKIDLNPLYEDNGSSGENSMYEGKNKIRDIEDTTKPGTDVRKPGDPIPGFDITIDQYTTANGKIETGVINSGEEVDIIGMDEKKIRGAGTKNFGRGWDGTYKGKPIVVKVFNNPISHGENIPSHQEAQDYNSSRSNKANGFVTIIVNSSCTNHNDSIPDHQEAQDYNSSRSNKANGFVTVIVNDNSSNNNGSIPDRQEAQDYNSSRSNKPRPLTKDEGGSTGNTGGTSAPNKTIIVEVYGRPTTQDKNNSSLQEAQDYNSSRSNKPRPLTKDGGDSTGNTGGTSAPNRTIIIKVCDNSTTQHENKPTPQAYQDYNSSRSNKANCLIVDAGGTHGNSDHTGNGWNFNVGLQVPVSKVFKIETGINYSSWNFKYAGSAMLSENQTITMQESIQQHSWKALTLSVGPAIHIGKGKLSATLYGKAGATFLTVPKQFIGFFDGGKVSKENGLARFSGDETLLTVQSGLRINYDLTRKLAIYLNPHFFTTVNKDLSYSEKDVSKAIDADGNFLYEKFMSLPFEKKGERLQSMGLSLGVSVAF